MKKRGKTSDGFSVTYNIEVTAVDRSRRRTFRYDRSAACQSRGLKDIRIPLFLFCERKKPAAAAVRCFTSFFFVNAGILKRSCLCLKGAENGWTAGMVIGYEKNIFSYPPFLDRACCSTFSSRG
jgi:hypothetical protein